MADSLFDNPDLYVERLDMSARRAVTWPMDRESYVNSVFLDERVQAKGPSSDTLSLAELAGTWRREKPQPGPVRFIFHTALCGSTLLSRCLDRPRKCFSLREPFLLHQLSFMRRLSPAVEKGFSEPTLVELVCALLNRSYSPDEVVVAKATDSCINIAESLLDNAAGSRGLLLYQDLGRFVFGMLRDGPRRRYVRAMVDRAHSDLTALGLMGDVDAGKLNDGQAAAYVWLGVVHWYRHLLAMASDRYRSLNSADFFESPGEVLGAIQRWFDLPFEADDVQQILDEGVMDRHSKHQGLPFDRSAYENFLGESEHALRGDVDAALRWAEDNGEGCPLAGPLDRDLLAEEKNP